MHVHVHVHAHVHVHVHVHVYMCLCMCIIIVTRPAGRVIPDDDGAVGARGFFTTKSESSSSSGLIACTVAGVLESSGRARTAIFL